jgi:hypothetical protein
MDDGHGAELPLLLRLPLFLLLRLLLPRPSRLLWLLLLLFAIRLRSKLGIAHLVFTLVCDASPMIVCFSTWLPQKHALLLNFWLRNKP